MWLERAYRPLWSAPLSEQLCVLWSNSGSGLLDLATHINRLHYNEGPEAQRRYVTTFLARLSPATHSLEVVNAGHNPAFLVSEVGEYTESDRRGYRSDFFPCPEYALEQFVLDRGSRLADLH